MQLERRHHLRYAATDSELCALGVFSNNLAFVRDIGAGGMQLQYLAEHDQGDQWKQVNVVSGDCDQILVAGVSCRMAYDIKSLMEDGTFSGLHVRLCGLVFKELTQVQETMIAQLITRCAACRNIKI